MALMKINDISPYFKHEKNKWIFTGTKLEIYVPKLYQERGLLILGDVATCLGIFQLRINGTFYADMMLLAKLSIEYVSSRVEKENDFEYIVLTLNTDSVFISNSVLVKDNSIIYEIFIVFLALGKIPPFISYETIHHLFDKDKEYCGVSLNVNHSVYEMIYAHMFRSIDEPYTFYRHTLMDKPPQIVAIHQISHAPQSSTARIVGSYLTEGMTAALVDETEHGPSLIENLLRA